MRVAKLTGMLLLPALCVAGSLGAQTPGDYALGGLRGQWKGIIENVTKAAEMMTETEYNYKPVSTVRSYGEVLAHVAGAQNSVCAAALGDKVPAEDAVEKTAKTKSAIVAALKASTTYCTKAYNLTTTRFNEPVDIFGSKSTRVTALALNLMHVSEHYGNLVTYIRLMNKIPPSSQPRP
ncbi:MAG: DinB family protein [Gemmatimonadetes bacterium]|nr:DinB family protein [Gemmatimonadota bacterium]